MKDLLIKAFLAVGGAALITHFIISHSKETVKNAVIWLAKKYPAFRALLLVHGQDIVDEVQAIADGVKEAVDEEKSQP